MSPAELSDVRWPHGAHLCMGIGDHTEERTCGNEEANALLIAAAPDLLEVLEIIVKTHDATCQGEGCQLGGIDLARAAIAKARGQQ
jgi:hypothetical protein